MEVRAQPSPPHRGISIKALHLRAERSSCSSRDREKRQKLKAAGLHVNQHKGAEQTQT